MIDTRLKHRIYPHSLYTIMPTATTVGSKDFNPDKLISDQSILSQVSVLLKDDKFRNAILTAFSLPEGDDYIYHATASVTLTQVQAAINAGSKNGLHDWYLDENGKANGHPSPADSDAYISLFEPSKVPANSLKGFVSNAKKGSLKSGVGSYLTSKRHVDTSAPTIAKRKRSHGNPYLNFLAYACKSLEYAGPDVNTSNLKTSHHVLPVLMHHFGCVCPSYEALAILGKLAAGRAIIDMGSGNGYWTYLLRHEHECDVVAIDSGQSIWRTMWIGDTIVADGVQQLRKRSGGKGEVLLLVYPIVSNQFTEKVIKEYKGDTICVAGTQNGNGYTGFKDETVDRWFEANMKHWKRIVQVPLPSFPGKDDALFVFKSG